MEQTRSWFNRFQPRGDRLKSNEAKKNGSTGSDSGKDLLKNVASDPDAVDELPSNITRQKVAAAKQYIENHYKSQMKNLQERKLRYTQSSFSSSLAIVLEHSLLGVDILVAHAQN